MTPPLIFKKPERQRDCFISKVNHVGSSRSVRLKIPYAKYVGYNGNILRLWIPEDASVKDIFDGYDAESMVATVHNNEKWFANSLTPEDIQTFFRKSYHQNSITLLMSDVKTHMIHYNGDVVDAMTDIKDMASCKLSVEIEIQGLYFFSTRFGLRWIVRSLHVSSVEGEAETAIAAAVDRESIEQAWEYDLEGLDAAVMADIEDYRVKIGKLRAFREDVKAKFAKARGFGGCSEEWNVALGEVATASAKYYNGSLFYL